MRLRRIGHHDSQMPIERFDEVCRKGNRQDAQTCGPFRDSAAAASGNYVMPTHRTSSPSAGIRELVPFLPQVQHRNRLN